MSEDDSVVIKEIWDQGFKACAAIKDAEIEQLRLDYERAVADHEKCKRHVDYLSTEKAALELSVKELRNDIIYALGAENMVVPSFTKRTLLNALAKSEHHNSRALEKMLLEAELKGLKSVWGTTQDYSYKVHDALEAKLAKLNKE